MPLLSANRVYQQKKSVACDAETLMYASWLFLQYRCTQTLAVDIHPAARIGKGVLLDHGTGLVIGETAVVGNNVSILHNVTLGGVLGPSLSVCWCIHSSYDSKGSVIAFVH